MIIAGFIFPVTRSFTGKIKLSALRVTRIREFSLYKGNFQADCLKGKVCIFLRECFCLKDYINSRLEGPIDDKRGCVEVVMPRIL